MTTHITGRNNDHIFYTVQTPAERTAAYRLGVNCGNGRFWFTRTNWNQFLEDTKEQEQQEQEKQS